MTCRTENDLYNIAFQISHDRALSVRGTFSRHHNAHRNRRILNAPLIVFSYFETPPKWHTVVASELPERGYVHVLHSVSSRVLVTMRTRHPPCATCTTRCAAWYHCCRCCGLHRDNVVALAEQHGHLYHAMSAVASPNGRK